MSTDESIMADKEIVLIPTGFLIPSENCYSFHPTLYAMKCCKNLINYKGVKVISLQLDQKIQPLLDKAFLDKGNLYPACDNEPLVDIRVDIRDGEYIMHGRKDMGFLHLLIKYGIKKGIPCFASDNFHLPVEKRVCFIVSRLLNLYEEYGPVVHVCSKDQAESIEKSLTIKIH